MADASQDLKDRILAEIAAHVRVYGRAQWDKVRERPEFAHVIGKEAGPAGRRKFFRWVDTVCAPRPDDADGPGRPHEGREASGEALSDAQKRALLAAQKNIPAAPSPAYLMRKGADADNQINFLAIVHEIMGDVTKLRAMSLKDDPDAPDGTGKRISNPHLFGQAIDKRLRVMETALKVMQEIWDLQYQQRFYDEITSIIVEELTIYPDIQERVIRRLADLNNRRGMTLFAEPG